MRKYLSLILLLFAFASLSFSQQRTDLEKKYVNETIYRYGTGFRKGSEHLRFGDLRDEFSTSQVGLELYEQAKHYKTTATVLKYLSLVASIVTISLVAKNGNVNTAYVGLGAQFVLMTGSAYYTTMSNEQMDRALWQRNKDVLFPPNSSQ